MTSNDAPNTGNEYLNVLADMTEKMTEHAVSTINRSQQAVIEAVANWTQATQTLLPQPPTADALQAMPKPTELVDRGFEIAEQLLQAPAQLRQEAHGVRAGADDRRRDQGGLRGAGRCRRRCGVNAGSDERRCACRRLHHQDGEERLREVRHCSVLTPFSRRSALITQHQQHHTSGLRVGLTLLALGAASAVAVVNALYDMVS